MGCVGIANASSPANRSRGSVLRVRPGFAVLAALVLPVALCGCVHGRGGAGSAPDYRAPLAELRPANGSRFQPASLYEGPVLATFFATWCFPCLGQLPYFAELQHEYGDRGLRVVAVGMDLEGHKVLDPFAAQFGWPFPVLVGSDALRSGQTPFGPVKQLPSTVILARDGSVVAAWPGVADAKDVRAAVETALQR